MAVRIRLLGPPRIERDGQPVAGPRGNKAWALAAYLLLSRRPLSRQRLADLLFSEAADPRAALRWNLAQLRRALGQPGAFCGDPVEPALHPSTSVDVDVLSSPGELDGGALDTLDGQLLEGMSFANNPALDAWLLVERRRVAAEMVALLRERGLAELGAEQFRAAAATAARLIELAPLDEDHHRMMVRSLLRAGDRDAALEHVDSCNELFQRELGRKASPALLDLVRRDEPSRPSAPVGGSSAARGQLEAGRAAISAGAVETGLACLRMACAEAESCGDDYLLARARLAVGSTLMHAVRGHSEGAEVLHKAADAARRVGASEIAATAHRELAWADMIAGRRARAEAWLAQAAEEANGSDEELASILGVRGQSLSDAARYTDALYWLERSVESARRCGNVRQLAVSTSLIGRVHLLTGRLESARAALEDALELVEAEQWIAFLSWPEALLAHVDLLDERFADARASLEHAFTLACQVGDPCWEGISARGLGILQAHRGHPEDALSWLLDARTRCTRRGGPYQWVQGWVLDALAITGLETGDSRTADWVEALETLSARTEMRELVLRAYLHRDRLGDPDALEVASLLAADIDNPALPVP